MQSFQSFKEAQLAKPIVEPLPQITMEQVTHEIENSQKEAELRLHQKSLSLFADLSKNVDAVEQ